MGLPAVRNIDPDPGGATGDVRGHPALDTGTMGESNRCAASAAGRCAARRVLGQQVIHADETPVQMLMPGTKKTHRSYVWAYATSQFSDVAAVVYDFSPSRAGEHARNFLQGWKGKLVCDDLVGYKASFELGVTEIGCMAPTPRKLFEMHATNKSTLAEQSLRYIQLLYEIESEVRDLEPDLRQPIRQEKAIPVMNSYMPG